MRGNSLISMANRGMSLIGIISGGVLVGFIGPELAIAIEGLCYIAAGFMLFFIAMNSFYNSKEKKSFYTDFYQELNL